MTTERIKICCFIIFENCYLLQNFSVRLILYFYVQFFVQLNELDSSGLFWREKARWIKYEENVEPSGNWGRPFLPFIEAECLQNFKQSLNNG